jgi:predicted esterase
MEPNDPHAGQPVLTGGAGLSEARTAVVMVHGRGATAESILTMVPAIGLPGVAYVAPQAHGNTWYPFSFLSPIPQNEPGISSGMRSIERVLSTTIAAGIPAERTVLLGFSQGACLTSEFVARHARRYGGVAGLSGGLIGPEGTPRDYPGSLEGTPVFLGCSDVDSHIPADRVRETREVLARLGATVDMRLYQGMGHTVNDDEIEQIRALILPLTQR